MPCILPSPALLAQTPAKHPALRLSGTKNLRFANAPLPRFSAIVEGFKSYAPDLVHDGGGFKSSYFAELARLEKQNFWFRSRNQLILWAIKKYCPDLHSFLEIGCGTGYVLSGVAEHFPQTELVGSEIFVAGLHFAAQRLPSAKLLQMDARNIPYHEEFDVIGAFDVIEHIEEDEDVISQIRAALKPHGIMLLTVPQHTWLWSPIDEYACHVRRYSASKLHAKIHQLGFKIVRSTSFVSILLPALIASRFLQSKTTDKKFDATAELKISSWLNSLFFQLLTKELWFIRNGFDFPAGGSRLVVARKL